MITYLARTLRKTYQKIRWRFSSIGLNCTFDKNINIKGGENIELGTKVHIGSYVVADTVNWGRGKITINDGSEIHDFAQLRCYGGDIEIGRECSVNPFCMIYGHGNLKIGNHVRIASHVVIIPANHKFDDLSTPIMYQGENRKGVTIKDDVWIGSGAIILDGVTIGKGSVIGAGAVVRNNVPECAVVAGVPAKIIKIRGRQEIGKHQVQKINFPEKTEHY